MDTKWNLPGSNSGSNSKRGKENAIKREKKAGEGRKAEITGVINGKMEAEKGKEFKGRKFEGGQNVNKSQAVLALLLALFMVISVAVPNAGAVTDDRVVTYFTDKGQAHSLEDDHEGTGAEVSRFFRGTTLLSRLITGRNGGLHFSIISDTGLLQQIWQNMNRLISNMDLEPVPDEIVETTSKKSRRSSDSTRNDDTPSSGDQNPGDSGEHDPVDPGENVENPSEDEPGNGNGGDNEGGNNEGDVEEPDSDDGETETGPEINYYTLDLTIIGQGTVTSSVYGEGPSATESNVTWNIKEGSNVTLTAVPGVDYTFLHWCNTVEEEESHIHESILTMVSAEKNLFITAHFEEKQEFIPERYDVTIKDTNGGSAAFQDFHETEDKAHSFEEGDLVKIEAAHSKPYQFSHWKVTDESNTEISEELGLTSEMLVLKELYFIMPAYNVVVEAIFDFVHPFEGGTGREEDPYQIKTADHLVRLTGSPTLKPEYADFEFQIDLMEAHYQLVDDIDLKDVEWSPVGGNDGNPGGSAAFTGIFDGNKKTISNLKIVQPDDSYQAMFHTIGEDSEGKKGMIKNLILKDPSVVAKSHGAVLAVNNEGIVESVVVRNSRVIADSHVAAVTVNNIGTVASTTVIDCSVTADSHAAGLAVYNNGSIERGRVESSTVTRLPLKGNDEPNTSKPMVIVGSDSVHDVYGAGLVVSNGLSGSIKKSSVEATILVKGKGQKRFAGLLVSENRGMIDQNYTIGIIDREAIGGTNELINQGGLVGINRNTKEDGNSFVTNSYTIVYQVSSGTGRGGAIGFQTNNLNPDKSTSIQFVYAVPYFQRTADDQIGGVMGGSVNRTLLSSYYDKTIFTKPVSGKGLGRITSEMMKEATFENWNFGSIWAIDKTKVINNGYPYLQWQYPE